MAASNTSILIVTNSKASSAQLEKLLRASDFDSIHTCQGAVSALQHMEVNPARILVIESKLDEIDGLEMVATLREIERDQYRFTYSILILTDHADIKHHKEVESTVDSFILLQDIHVQLPAQMRTAERLSNQINSLLNINKLLMDECNQLQMGHMLDPLTGLGNMRQARQSLNDTIRQIDSRGGAVCFVLIDIGNHREIAREYDNKIAQELIVAIAERIRHLVRPLDRLTYFDTGLFALILHQPNIEDCKAESYARLYDGVRYKSYRTSVGFLSAKIGMSICASGAETGPPKAEQIISTARSNLEVAHASGEIQVNLLMPLMS